MILTDFEQKLVFFFLLIQFYLSLNEVRFFFRLNIGALPEGNSSLNKR